MKPQGARQREGASERERERERGIERVRKKTPQRESQTRDVIKQVLFQFSGEPERDRKVADDFLVKPAHLEVKGRR